MLLIQSFLFIDSKKTVLAGFEPARAEPNRFQVYLLKPLGHNTLISHTGTRTRVGWVKTSYPNHLDYMGVESLLVQIAPPIAGFAGT